MLFHHAHVDSPTLTHKSTSRIPHPCTLSGMLTPCWHTHTQAHELLHVIITRASSFSGFNGCLTGLVWLRPSWKWLQLGADCGKRNCFLTCKPTFIMMSQSSGQQSRGNLLHIFPFPLENERSTHLLHDVCTFFRAGTKLDVCCNLIWRCVLILKGAFSV